MNTELFYDNQLATDSLTWRLYASGKGTPSGSNLVLTGLLGDTEVNYSVSHEFSEASDKITNGASAVSDKINEWMSAIRVGSSVVSTVQDLATKASNSKLFEGASDVLKGVSSGIDSAKNFDLGGGNTLGSKLSSRFVSALDFIKVFKGTSVSIELPKLEVLLFNDDNGATVTKKVEDLNDVFIGDINDAAGIFGLQDAPNGYIPSYQGISETTKFEGTFTLQLGDKYSIDNLIVKDYNVTLSQMKQIGSSEPLYAEVSVSLDFASYVSKKHIAKFLRPIN